MTRLECPSETELADYLSGLLTGEGSAAVDAHVDKCPRCRSILSLLAKGWASGAAILPQRTEDRPELLLGARFVIEDLAATGGMGVIYRARDRVSGEVVAVKVMSTVTAAHQEHFEHEAQILAELRHPGIVRYICHGALEPEGLFLAMEWLDGEDLAQTLSRGALPLIDSVLLIERLAAALAEAHARGVVHRDIKPRNIFLVGRRLDAPKLLDFGLARVVSMQPAAGRMVVGTPGYMAPEQARGQTDIDGRADVFALGCTLFECLAGRPLFVAERLPALLGKIVVEEAPWLLDVVPDAPPALAGLLASMLAKDPEQRPRDAAAVAEALRSLRSAMDWAPPRTSATAALTTSELRIATAVVTAGGGDDTLGLAGAGRAALASYGGRVESLRDGTLLVTLAGAGAAHDQAARAALSALELRRLLPRAPIALATGRANAAADRPIGDAIERAAALCALAEGAGAAVIRVDDVTARLLETRFEMDRDADGPLLGRAREEEAVRTLLGQPTPCVGRAAEILSLCTLIEQAIGRRRAQAIVVVGAPGIGKSRIRDEVVRGAPAFIFMGWGDPVGAGSTFGLVADLLRRASDVRADEPLETRQSKLCARVAASVPPADVERITQFFGEIVGARFEGDMALRAARQDPRLMGDQFRRAFIDFIQAECARGPLLLVLEDLHWGDGPTVNLLDDVLRIHASLPVVILALARPEALDLFPSLWSHRRVELVHLDSLPPAAAADLVRAVLGARLDEAAVARMVERAGGNPFFLEELVRAASEGMVDEAPATVVAMTQARLEALPPRARKALRAASVFGQTFWSGGVRALIADDEADVLEDLCRRELVTPQRRSRFAGDAELSFRHDLLRAAAYAMLMDEDRKLGHRLAGEWLERAGENDALVLAEHYERGAAPDRAMGWYERGANQALEGNDLAAVIARADAGARCGATGAALGSLRRVRAEAHRWRAENAEAEADAAAAMDLLPPGSDAWCDAARTLAVAAGNQGHIDRVRDLVDALRSVPSPPSAALIVAAMHVATELLGAAVFKLAAELLDEMERASAGVDPAVRAHIVHTRAIQAFLVGDPADYLDRMVEAADCYDQAGDQRNAARSRVNLGFGYLLLGSIEEADACLRATLSVAQRMGLRYVAGIANHNLGLVLARAGRLDEAIRVETETVEDFRAQGHQRLEGCSRDYLAVILTLAGDLEAAEHEARTAVSLLRAAAPTRAPRACSVLAQVLLARGRPDEALAAAQQGMDAQQAIEDGSSTGWAPDAPFIRLVHAEALHATGEAAGAREAIAVCRDRLMMVADRIRQPARRASFLERVPEHARVLALAGAWLHA